MASASEPSSSQLSIALLLMGATCLLLINAFYYYPMIADDAFISLRYAQRLTQGKGLTWNDGEAVEGYSDLLWVLLTAGLGAAGFNWEGAVRLLGIVSAVLTLPLLALHARAARLSPIALAIGLAIVVVSPPVAMWAVGGLEPDMVMLLLTAAIGYCYLLWDKPLSRYAAAAGLCLGLLCWLRPEGPVYVLAIAGSLLLTLPHGITARMRLLAPLCLIPLLCFCVQLAFRWHVYHQWVPNTVLAKITFTHSRFVDGFMYTVKGVFAFIPLLLYAFLNYRHTQKTGVSGFMRFLALIFTVLCLSFWASGGDTFPGFRPFVPLIAILAMMAMHSIDAGMLVTSRKKELLFFLYIFTGYIWLQFSVDVNQRYANNNWGASRQLGLALKERYGKTGPVIAVYTAGAVPFYSELPALDVYGLTDGQATRHPEQHGQFGKNTMGHELFDGNYVESRKPDILVFNVPHFVPLCEKGGAAQCEILFPHYRPETLHIPGYDVTIWLRKDDPLLDQ